jgi:hypothetical protein
MPINRLLKGKELNPDDVELLTVAFNLALRELRLVDRNDPVCDIVDPNVVEIGTKDTRDPQEIASRTVKQIGVLR